MEFFLKYLTFDNSVIKFVYTNFIKKFFRSFWNYMKLVKNIGSERNGVDM